MYKEAIRAKLKFNTSRGVVSLEQLWDLPMTILTETIKDVNKSITEITSDDNLSFLSEDVEVNPETQMRFDILKDVYTTKKKEREALRDAATKKEHNEKLMTLIHAKQEEDLKGKTVEELKAMMME